MAHGLVPHDGRRLTFWGLQGVTVGRPGRVRVSVEIEGGPVAVSVGERAVIAFETLIHV